MRFTRSDSLKFFLYTTLFFFLFLGYNRASGPYFETTYDSASIQNQELPVSEVPVQEAIVHQDTAPENVETVPRKRNIPTKKPDTDPLTIAFNPEYIKVDDRMLERLRETAESPYFRSKVTPLNLVLDAERQEPRGQVTGNKLTLSTAIQSDSEQIKVFVHELGHIVDIFYLKKGFFWDPSDIFYDISWESFNTKKKGQKITDFVSGYALSNKYEDFAESFAFYVFHNEDFANRAKTNPTLRKKYDFFGGYVFDKDAFVGTSFGTGTLKSYNWDITKVPVDTQKYLYYVK